MGLQFYKPNKGNTGGACTFSFNSKEECVFVELVKQNGWDAAGRGGQGNGIFKGGDKSNIKLSLNECGAIIRAIETNSAGVPAMIHKNDNGSKTVRFGQWPAKDAQGNGEFKGWSVSVLAKDKDGKETKISCSLSFDEVIVIREYLKFALVHIFSAIYADDKKRAKEYAEKRDGGGLKVTETKFDEPPKKIEEFVKSESAPAEDDDGGF
jgi:hypothetical protein